MWALRGQFYKWKWIVTLKKVGGGDNFIVKLLYSNSNF